MILSFRLQSSKYRDIYHTYYTMSDSDDMLKYFKKILHQDIVRMNRYSLDKIQDLETTITNLTAKCDTLVSNLDAVLNDKHVMALNNYKRLARYGSNTVHNIHHQPSRSSSSDKQPKKSTKETDKVKKPVDPAYDVEQMMYNPPGFHTKKKAPVANDFSDNNTLTKVSMPKRPVTSPDKPKRVTKPKRKSKPIRHKPSPDDDSSEDEVVLTKCFC